ncbi:MAG: serpin family protein [Chloroflexota bacterium]|nr:MAG: serpin family protein [Chloroflexota bacterium]
MHLILLILVLNLLVGCGPAAFGGSNVPREKSPNVPGEDARLLVDGNTAFALDLYQRLIDDGSNLIYSPYSSSLALAMTYAGARGETEQQIAQVMHFSLPQERLHPAFNALDQALVSPDNSKSEEGAFQLHIANSLWGQQNYEFLPEFLDTLSMNYGGGLRMVDFQSSPDVARQAINDWVSDQTKEIIKDILPPGSVSVRTRLALANAIYFKANWLNPFESYRRPDIRFNLLDGSQVIPEMMSLSEELKYASGDSYQAVELPYVPFNGNSLSMIILLPDPGTFAEFERSLDTASLDEIMRSFLDRNVDLKIPRFEYDSSVNLRNTLSDMGMPDAFNQNNADFSGMDGTRGLFIDSVHHKACIAVDEFGTEAAAATIAIVAQGIEIFTPEVELTVDRPFIFLIRHQETGAILFMGRVLDPTR